MFNFTLREKMFRLNVKQSEMIREFRKRGFEVNHSQMSKALNGSDVAPKSQEILKEIQKYLEEKERT